MSPREVPDSTSGRLRGARILVTGGSGFIGTNLVQYLVQSCGADVCSVDVRPPRHPSPAGSRRQLDIRDEAAIRNACLAFAPDFAIHLAARTDLLETRDLRGYAANIEGVQHVLESLAEVSVMRRVLVASSRMVCRIGVIPASDTDYSPPNLYGQSKVRTEEIVRAGRWPFEWVLVRPTSIWGEWFEIPYRTFFDSIAAGRFRHVSGRDPVKSFGYVGNFVWQLAAMLIATEPSLPGSTLYQCDYPPLHLREWSDLIRRAMGLPAIGDVAAPVLRGAALAGDLLKVLGMRHPPLTSFRLDNLLTDMVYPTTTLERVCGPLPFGLAEAVERTVDWMRSS